jgi:hypothetical protein
MLTHLPPLHPSTALRRGRQAAAALTAFADALRAAGDVEGVSEVETVAEVVGRRLARLEASRRNSHALTMADHSLNAVA